MPWLRAGDTVNSHPAMLAAAVVSGADTRTQNEVFGFVVRLGTMSAGHLTDSVVEVGAVYTVGGPNADRLVEQAVECGMLTPTEVDGRQAWKIINDPSFLHIRTRAEVEWDRTRKRDNGNTAVTMDVQRRDGSACRYCGRSVNWRDRSGGRGATYDHVTPPPIGQSVPPATSPDELVVACRSCNSSRGAAHRDGHLAVWDTQHPRRPVPKAPLYCEYLAARLGVPATPSSDHDHPRTWDDHGPSSADAERPAQLDPAPTEQRSDTTVSDSAPTEQRPSRTDTAAEAAPARDRSPPPGDGYGSQLPGTGRARSGQDRKGRQPPARRRGARRSRRTRPGPSKSPPTEQEKRS